MAAVYGLVVGEQPQQPAAEQPQPQAQQPAAGQPQQQPQPQQPAAAYVFAPADITNPYAMTWAAYSTRLKPYLDATYPAVRPQADRRQQAQAQAQAPEAGAGNRGETLAAIKAALKSANSPLKTVNPAWSNNRINNLVDSAAPPAVDGAVFVLDNFANSILAELNTLARQNANRGNAPQLVAPIAINRANIGV